MSTLIDNLEQFVLTILEKIHLKKLADWYREHKEGMRYLIFGALTTIVNIVTYIILAKLILSAIQNENIRVNVSEIMAFITAVAFAYVTNKLYVFESKTQSKKELLKEITSFIGCRIFTEIISIIMMNAAIKFSINDVFMKIIANIVVIVLNFIFSKVFIFKKQK